MKVGTGEGRRIKNAVSADRAGPLCAAGTQPAVPRAPLQGVAQDQKRSITGFLTFTEAVSLMLASKDMYRAIKADPLLRLDEISPAFDRLGCNDLRVRIRSVEAGISRLQPNRAQVAALPEPPPESKQQPDPEVAAPGAPAAPAALALASHWVKLARARAAHASQTMQRARQAKAEKHLHEMEAQKAQLTAQMAALEPGMEAIVFHFAAQRMKGPRPPRAADARPQSMEPPQRRPDWLYRALEDGDVGAVRVGLREFLSLSPALMSNSRKVALLREPGGMCTLEIIGRRCCGSLKTPERRCFEAVGAYVDEIVSSEYLLPFEKLQLCFKLERVTRDAHSGAMEVIELDIIRHALRSSNPAVAASILLGIHNSSADATLKQFLLATIGASWDGGLASCVNGVSLSLRGYAHRAPEWVEGMLAGLMNVKRSAASPIQAGM